MVALFRDGDELYGRFVGETLIQVLPRCLNRIGLSCVFMFPNQSDWFAVTLVSSVTSRWAERSLGAPLQQDPVGLCCSYPKHVAQKHRESSHFSKRSESVQQEGRWGNLLKTGGSQGRMLRDQQLEE